MSAYAESSRVPKRASTALVVFILEDNIIILNRIEGFILKSLILIIDKLHRTLKRSVVAKATKRDVRSALSWRFEAVGDGELASVFGGFGHFDVRGLNKTASFNPLSEGISTHHVTYMLGETTIGF